jgi:hypothetical protein
MGKKIDKKEEETIHRWFVYKIGIYSNDELGLDGFLVYIACEDCDEIKFDWVDAQYPQGK